MTAGFKSAIAMSLLSARYPARVYQCRGTAIVLKEFSDAPDQSFTNDMRWPRPVRRATSATDFLRCTTEIRRAPLLTSNLDGQPWLRPPRHLQYVRLALAPRSLRVMPVLGCGRRAKPPLEPYFDWQSVQFQRHCAGLRFRRCHQASMDTIW